MSEASCLLCRELISACQCNHRKPANARKPVTIPKQYKVKPLDYGVMVALRRMGHRTQCTIQTSGKMSWGFLNSKEN